MALTILLLVSALCIDIFAAGAAYGANKIRLSQKQTVFINLICTAVFFLSCLFGSLLAGQLPLSFFRRLCFSCFLFLGLSKLTEAFLGFYLRRCKRMGQALCLHFAQLHILIQIYADPLEADADKNRSLSEKELLLLALAMSLDSLFSGISAAFLQIPLLLTCCCIFAAGVLLTRLGLFCGQKLSRRCPKDLSWLCGLLFLFLAFCRH